MEAEQPEEVVVKRYVYSLVSSKAFLDLDECLKSRVNFSTTVPAAVYIVLNNNDP